MQLLKIGCKAYRHYRAPVGLGNYTIEESKRMEKEEPPRNSKTQETWEPEISTSQLTVSAKYRGKKSSSVQAKWQKTYQGE